MCGFLQEELLMALSRYDTLCNQAIQMVRNVVEQVIGEMKLTVSALSRNIRDDNAPSLVTMPCSSSVFAYDELCLAKPLNQKNF